MQGVGFRYAMRSEARQLGITGWVRNQWDGSVEALIQGDVAALEAMLAWCEKGPAFARVDHVASSLAGGEEPYDSFTIRG